MMTSKRAVLVGIDQYDAMTGLDGCVNDVRALEPLLMRHEDDSPNFTCLSYSSHGHRIGRRALIGAIEQLCAPGAEVALFYFAGHGIGVDNDVVLVTQDARMADDGVPLSTILGKVQTSKVTEVIIILDCCFSGAAGGVPQLGGNVAALRSGLTLLSASRSDQTAAETDSRRGVFSLYLCGALEGGAADVLGKVTLAGVYAYLTESFGAFDQRPTFKTNVDRLHVLRNCKPAVELEILRRLPTYFAYPDKPLPLDPSYEPTAQPSHPEHEAVFADLQRCTAAKLVEPVGVAHMYYAAIDSKACRLTALGKRYRRLAEQGRI